MNTPNIIIILADDMGYGDLHCYNNESLIPTPNMDYLAAQGIRFHDAHSASAVCTPSRYGILTGRYCWRSSLKSEVLYGYEPPLIEINRLTIAKMLKSSGYNTACIGKWHLGLDFRARKGDHLPFDRPLPWPGITEKQFEENIDFNAPFQHDPLALGFDYFFGTSGCSTCQPPYGFIENDAFIEIPSVYRNVPLPTSRRGMAAPGWSDKDVDVIFTEKATTYIKEQSTKNDPFFLYLAASSPHEPCIESVVPEFARNKSKAGPRGDMVWLFDWMVGRIVEVLQRTKQDKNTLLIVTSDNGALPGDRRWNNSKECMEWHTYGHKSSGNFRGYKSHIWEGGHREPLIAHWPDRINPGTSTDELVCLNDIMATCASIVNYALPQNAAEDSYNVLPLLIGADKKPIRDSLIHHSHFGVFSIRQGKWKMIYESEGSGGWPPPWGKGPQKGEKGQLYNMQEDPEETCNIWDERKDIVNHLTILLQKQSTYARSAP